jgi:predicted nuclease with TOPRIM domain
MEVKDYCNNVQMELNNWKARLYDIIRKIDQIPTGEKQKMHDEIESLHMIVTELEDRIDNLRTNCPTEWEPERKELGAKVEKLAQKYEELWHYPGLGEDTYKPGA